MKAKSSTNLRTYLSEWNGDEAHERIIAEVDYHFIPKMPNVLDQVTYSGVVVKHWSGELLQKLALLDLLGEGRLVDIGSWSRVTQ